MAPIVRIVSCVLFLKSCVLSLVSCVLCLKSCVLCFVFQIMAPIVRIVSCVLCGRQGETGGGRKVRRKGAPQTIFLEENRDN